MHTQTRRVRLIAAMIIGSLVAQEAAYAQFGGLFGRRSSSNQEEQAQNNCDTAQGSVGRSMLGSVLGSLAGSASSRLGGVGTFIPSAQFADVLATEIACKLNEDEQEQAAEATLEATRGEEVGSTASWTSTTRQNVSGTSTVTARNALADGSTCMTVTDVVIIDGEETTVPKRMCRGPGQSRYTLVQA